MGCIDSRPEYLDACGGVSAMSDTLFNYGGHSTGVYLRASSLYPFRSAETSQKIRKGLYEPSKSSDDAQETTCFASSLDIGRNRAKRRIHVQR